MVLQPVFMIRKHNADSIHMLYHIQEIENGFMKYAVSHETYQYKKLLTTEKYCLASFWTQKISLPSILIYEDDSGSINLVPLQEDRRF